MTEDIPADLAVAAWAMEAHLCNEAFASRWPPPSVDLNGAPARNGSERARQNPGSRASGCGEASYWIERVDSSASNPVPSPRASSSSADAKCRGDFEGVM